MTLEYDLDVGALYIRLSAEAVARTEEFGANAHVDLDSAGRVVGVEVCSAAYHWPLAEILASCELDPDQAAQLRAYFLLPAGNTPAAPRAQEALPVVTAMPTPPVGALVAA
jgi:uncharacterized protein YuzE